MISNDNHEIEGGHQSNNDEIISVHENERTTRLTWSSILGRPYIRDDEAVEKSPISWPFTLSGTFLTLGNITIVFTIIIVTIVSCNSNGSCNAQDGWPVEIWGERDRDDWVFWCEESNEDDFLAQKSNSLSNFSFMIAGSIVFSCAIADILRRHYREKDRQKHDLENKSSEKEREYVLRNHVTDWPMFSIINAIGLWWGGVASFLMHGHPTALTGALDVGSIWWMINPLLIYTAVLFTRAGSRYKQTIRRIAEIAILVMDGVFTWMVYDSRIEDSMKATQAAVGVLVTTLFVFVCLRCLKVFQKPASIIWGRETNWRMKTNVVVASLCTIIIFIVAYLVQEQSINVKCNPTSWFQPHAAWHSLCGIGFLSVYLALFRAEDFDTCESDSQEATLKKEEPSAHVAEAN